MAGAPTEIRLSRAERILYLRYPDGEAFALSAELLRTQSPSAEVQGHGAGQKISVPGKRHVAIIGIEPVGNYAVRLTFDDGHDTGIFSWDYLYDLGARQDNIWADYLADLAGKNLSRD